MSRFSAASLLRSGVLACVFLATQNPAGAEPPPAKPVFSLEDLARTRNVNEVSLSPDGAWIAFTLAVPRAPGVDSPGPTFSELHLIPFSGSPDRGFVTGQVSLGHPRWSPDGKFIAFLAKRGDDTAQALWAIPLEGGEAFRLAGTKTDIQNFDWRPDGKGLAFVAAEPLPEEQEKLKKKGFNQEIFEEDWRPRRIYLVDLPDGPGGKAGLPRPLGGFDGQPWSVLYSPQGKSLLVDLSPRPLVDDQYMARRLTVLDAATGAVKARIDNTGKLGAFKWSRDGSQVVFVSAADIHDTREGRLMAASATGGAGRDLLPDLQGHVEDFSLDPQGTVTFLAAVGTGSWIGRLPLAGPARPIYDYQGANPVFFSLAADLSGKRFALTGETPAAAREVFALQPASLPRRLTESNPWFAERTFGRQQVVTWTARDGVTVEGILIHPLGREPLQPVPLIVVAHGGPEGHYKNGWLTRYSEPGQAAAGKGYAVFYPNYRGSTGRGAEFIKAGQGEAGRLEFTDVLDGIDTLIKDQVADPDRVGITGGSYGGYFTALAATRHSDRFAAGVMFVGVSDNLMKHWTTDIPREDELVHWLVSPLDNPRPFLDSSPIHFVKQARTPLLIVGGKDDTRIDPSQSKALYRALKRKGDVPVRWVLYPGEGHGNRNSASRYDLSLRLMQWFDHFLKEGKKGLPPAAVDYQFN